MGIDSIDKLMAEARRLAVEYRQTTGKTLPVTSEIAVYDAIRLLNLDQHLPGRGVTRLSAVMARDSSASRSRDG
jgi:hypothetical protein